MQTNSIWSFFDEAAQRWPNEHPPAPPPPPNPHEWLMAFPAQIDVADLARIRIFQMKQYIYQMEQYRAQVTQMAEQHLELANQEIQRLKDQYLGG